MNTKGSVIYGWGVLIVAGAGSYYFAKRSINADREERAHAEERRRQHRERLRAQETVNREAAMSKSSSSGKAGLPFANKDHPSPSREGSDDPAPVSHTEEGSIPRSKYEASEPFRSRKGDRFS